MLSAQFHKLLKSFDRPGIDPNASQEETVAAYRKQTDDCLVVDGVAPAVAATTAVETVSAGGVPSEWVVAEDADPDLRLMFIHGGAFIAGTLDGYRHQVEALSRATGMAVLAIDYRLAPEHPYPAGLDDCVAAWTWMLAHGPAGEGVSRDVFLAGDSAGGNLTMALLLRLRDEARRLPRAAAAFAPATDFTGTSPSMTERAHLDPAIDPATLPWVASLYITDGTPLTDPYVSPVYGDFTGLPPFLVHAGEREVLHDDGKRVVEAARKAGVDACFKTLPGLIHCTEYWCHYVPEGLASLNEVGAYLKSYG
jgi:epsilon-lactone hydrolase